uniref:cyclase family protein n=1 Tax=Enemella evansiae TaxID=2016499 RepID=UPI003983C431
MIDLSTPVTNDGYEHDPVTIDTLNPRQGAEHMAATVKEKMGIEFDVDLLPEGEMLSLERVSLTSHTGTHVDAPAHYGSRTQYGEGVPRSIDQMPLEWFFGPGRVVDVSALAGPVISASELQQACRDAAPIEPGDIVLLHTGADQLAGTPEYFTNFKGIDGPGCEWLLDQGVRVIGTDAFSLDGPFGHMLTTYLQTRDQTALWPAHFVGRRREYCQIERLANLDQLVGETFTLACFPIAIAGAGAGWARAVAMVDDEVDPKSSANSRR